MPIFKKKAEKKIKTLHACIQKYEDQRAVAASKCNSLKESYSSALDRIRMAQATGDIQRRDQIAADAQLIKDDLSMAESIYNIYASTYQLLYKLNSLARFLNQTGNHLMVIRSIPHRKLPRLISDPSQLQKLVDLIASSYSHLKDTALAAFEGQESLLKAVHDIDKSHALQMDMIRSQYGTDQGRNAVLEEALGDEYAKTKAYAEGRSEADASIENRNENDTYIDA